MSTSRARVEITSQTRRTRRGVRAPFYMKVGRNWGGMSSSTKEADIQFLVGRLRDFYQSANS